VTLYQRTGEELLAAAENEKLRPLVMDILSDRMFPQGSNTSNGLSPPTIAAVLAA